MKVSQLTMQHIIEVMPEASSSSLYTAVDERTPLLERAKFLAIFTANLDEFFMKRIAVLRETLTPERLKLLEQLRAKLLPMLHRQAEGFRDSIVPGVGQDGIPLTP